MANIGNFKKLDSGAYKGDIATLAIKVSNATIEPVAQPVESGPSHRIYGPNGAEIGAGWSKMSESSRPYISIKLDDPSFQEPIYGALVENREGGFTLIWNRPDPVATRPGSTPAQDAVNVRHAQAS